MQYCGYCGGRVGWSAKRLAHIHLDSGDRVSVSPGDYASEYHNRAGTRVGGCDIVQAGVRHYLIFAAKVCPNDYTQPLRITVARGTWTLRTVATVS